jgi:hypothetical protein
MPKRSVQALPMATLPQTRWLFQPKVFTVMYTISPWQLRRSHCEHLGCVRPLTCMCYGCRDLPQTDASVDLRLNLLSRLVVGISVRAY